MTHNRRDLLIASAGALYAAGTAVAAGDSQNEETALPGRGKSLSADDVLDYVRSFVTFIVDDGFNYARLQVESRAILLDRDGQTIDEFFQFASCKSEDTHGTKDLFYKDNYDFSGVFGRDSYVLFRAGPTSPRYAERKQIGKGKGRFDTVEIGVHPVKTSRALKSNADIVRATRAGELLVGRTEISDEQSGRRAILEFPIKTMNVNLKKQIYQIDTGPLAFPDFKVQSERPIDMIELAYVAHNRPDIAYFIVQRPMPLTTPAGKPVEMFHYSDTFGLPSKNQLFAVR